MRPWRQGGLSGCCLKRRPDFLLRQSQERRGRCRSLSAFDFAARPVFLFRRACRSDRDWWSRVADFRDLDCPGWHQIVLSCSLPTSPKKVPLAHQRGAVRRPGHFRQPGRLSCSYRLADSAVRLAGSYWDSAWPFEHSGPELPALTVSEETGSFAPLAKSKPSISFRVDGGGCRVHYAAHVEPRRSS
jgi:hypothetical protein